MTHLVYIFIGGGAGSACRYLVSIYAAKTASTMYPVGTLLVNLLGSFLIGIAYELFERQTISPETRSLLATGFLGGFTTFSTFALENTNMLRTGEYRHFWTSIITQNVLSLLSVIMGIILVRYLLKSMGR